MPALVAGADPATIRVQLATGSTEAAAVVTRLYASVLGHGPDMAGAAAASAALVAGAITIAALRATLSNSLEATAIIGGLYGQVLGRTASPAELAQAQSGLAAGGSAAALRVQLAASAEAATAVDVLYQQVLGRNADPAGLSLFTNALGTSLSVSDVRAQLTASPEAQARLVTVFELAFGRTPPAATIATLDSSLARGQPFAVATQVTARFESRHDATFNYGYGYATPAQYSATGATQFLLVYDTATSNLNQSGFLSVPVATSSIGSGPDTIVINLQAIGSAPVAFLTATLDGALLGSAAVDAHPATQPFTPQIEDQVTFKGAFGSGLHDLRLQVADPANGAVSVQDVATFDGNPFLLGRVTTNAAGVADIFPHAGPQPAVLFTVS